MLHRHAQRVARIAQGLLSFARQAPGEGTRAPVDLNALVEDTLLLVEKQVVKEGIAIKRRARPRPAAPCGATRTRSSRC